ncbi:YraN family protein [Bacteroides propionicifaciens]|uniref:YraN family protein n=1 Tax=Bacteroides propionicifaciens TaxID=392838 RepID=UPI001EE2989D|nr:YraN family protein [Bacteroides propionicifaciens]
MAKHNILGQKGEEEAKLYLEAHGYKIIELNWTYRHLEIDIIALKSNTLSFIEVKTRENKLYGEPYQPSRSKSKKTFL